MSTIGIDLGTTNTAAAIRKASFPIESDGLRLLPSVVAFPPNKVTLVGSVAKRRRAIDTRNTLYAAKRLIGRKWRSDARRSFAAHYPHELVEQYGAPVFKTRAGLISPSDVAVSVLARVAERSPLPFSELNAVIAVPALFGELEREATRQAGLRAGLKSVRIIDEPMATAIAYLARLDERPARAVVYDFGGGTFDVAIIDCSGKSARVIAHAGDLYLGGDDVDMALAAWAAQKTIENANWDLKSDPAVFSRLVGECERAKIRLANMHETRLDLAQVDPGIPPDHRELLLQSEQLAQEADQIVRRSFALCDQVLRQAGLQAAELDAVFAAGGATLLAQVRQGIEGYFGKPVHYPFDPLEIVCIGASIA